MLILLTVVIVIFILIYKIIYAFSSEHFKTALVSLDKDKERRDYVLSKINIDHIYAVNGFKLDLTQLEKEGKILKDSKIKKGVIGCYLSHVHMLQNAMDSKDLLIVLEDDIDIPQDFYKKVNEVLYQAPKDFELLFLSYNYKETYEYENISLVHGTQAYIINGKNITQDKINSLFPIRKPIDVILPSVFTRSYIIVPQIAKLSKFASYSNTERLL